ncbi:MAG TPA: TonB family protein [Opitutaceae bacterium]|jgi:TonB family protein|nr:TonB family protein [Opitutaceae bacterium]
MKTPLPFVSLLIFCALTSLYGQSAATPPVLPPLPQIIQTVAPLFPIQMTLAGISTGKVKFIIKVDKTGKLEDLLVTEYTQRAFADEATKVVRQWTFAPAWVGTEPVGWVRELNLYFRTDGMMVTYDNAEAPSHFKMTDHPDEKIEYHACSLRDLDRIPVPLHVVAPTAALQPDAGEVRVEFYIDEDGRVRIPVARETSDVAFANAAVDAVSQWQFEPPTSKGKAVLVHAVQTFTINPETLGNTNANVQRTHDVQVSTINPVNPDNVNLNVQSTNLENVKVFDLADLDEQPVVRFRAPITNPTEMSSNGIQGTTTVGFICDSKGHVQEAHVVTSSGSTELDQAAIDGVSQWIFKPGRKGGHAVNSRMTVPIAFNLNSSS